MKYKSAKAKDNIGLAYKYAQKFCPPNIPIEDSDVFADALIGLVQAERDYDPTRLNEKGKPLAFSTCAYKYMWTACVQGYRERCKQDRLDSWNAEEEWQFGLSEDESIDNYAANAVTEYLKGMKLPGHLQRDLELLLTYYLQELTLSQVGALQNPPICKERVRQRINRVKEYLASTVNYEVLEEIANVGSYRDGIQRWWKNDLSDELLSNASAA